MNDAHEIFSRLLRASQAKSDAALAVVLNVSPQSISQARKKNQVPPLWVLAIAGKFEVTADWLFFGRGPMRAEEHPHTGAGHTEGACRECPEIEQLQKRVIALQEQLVASQAETITVYKTLTAYLEAPPEKDRPHPPLAAQSKEKDKAEKR